MNATTNLADKIERLLRGHPGLHSRVIHAAIMSEDGDIGEAMFHLLNTGRIKRQGEGWVVTK